jgi:hypothetical protein
MVCRVGDMVGVVGGDVGGMVGWWDGLGGMVSPPLYKKLHTHPPSSPPPPPPPPLTKKT